MRHIHPEILACVGLSLCLSAAVSPTLDSRIVGLFHDDGLYAVLAKTLVEGGQYCLSNLPSHPPQTKYPPVYSLLLAGVWWAFPSFPDNIIWLKALNLAFFAATLVGVAMLGSHGSGRYRMTVSLVLVSLVGTNPGIVGFVDYTMSDTLFTTLVVWVLVWQRPVANESLRGRQALVALLSTAAILTRNVGVCLAAAVFIDNLVNRKPRWAAVNAAIFTLACSAWYVWVFSYRRPLGTILNYYQGYEQSAVELIRSAPALAAAIVAGNARMAAETGALVMGPAWAYWPILTLLALAGIWGMSRSGQRLPVIFAVTYSAVVLAHPFSPHRYLLPLIPVFYLAVVTGASMVADQLNRTVLRPPVRPLPHLAVGVTAAVLLLGNAVWFQYRLRPLPSDHVRGWYGIDMGYSWKGFEETFEWIRANTSREARLGSIFDPMYFLYTGRRAVRPWFHHPETYFYPYGKAQAFVGRPADVAAELLRLRIDYLVLDPPTGYAEGNAATAMLHELLILPAVNGSMVFRSSDGRHEVYRLYGQGFASGWRPRQSTPADVRPPLE